MGLVYLIAFIIQKLTKLCRYIYHILECLGSESEILIWEATKTMKKKNKKETQHPKGEKYWKIRMPWDSNHYNHRWWNLRVWFIIETGEKTIYFNGGGFAQGMDTANKGESVKGVFPTHRAEDSCIFGTWKFWWSFSWESKGVRSNSQCHLFQEIAGLTAFCC